MNVFLMIEAVCVFGIIACIAWERARRRTAARKAEQAAQEDRARMLKAAQKKREKQAAQKEARAQRAADAARRAEEGERRKAEKHAASMQRAEEKHAQRMRHAQELAAVKPPKAAQEAPKEAQTQQAEEVQQGAQSVQQAATVTPEAFAAQHASPTPRKASGAFAGQTVAFTGRLYGLPRAEAIKAVQARGGRAFAGMPAGTTLLVVGTLKGKKTAVVREIAGECIGGFSYQGKKRACRGVYIGPAYTVRSKSDERGPRLNDPEHGGHALTLTSDDAEHDYSSYA